MEGAKLLALTNEYFKDSDVNIRAVMSLLLGGIYYVVWHAENNKSTVAGIDINREKDREELIRTIGHILSWAWKAAEKK